MLWQELDCRVGVCCFTHGIPVYAKKTPIFILNWLQLSICNNVLYLSNLFKHDVVFSAFIRLFLQFHTSLVIKSILRYDMCRYI